MEALGLILSSEGAAYPMRKVGSCRIVVRIASSSDPKFH